jgi:ABC-type Zn uptake system ZnuABC Zn-binding protein ZnuA
MEKIIKITTGIIVILLLGNLSLNADLDVSQGVKEADHSLFVKNSLNVVASISIIADFASNLGEGLFTVTSIVDGSENPHVYEPTASEIESVAQADLFIIMGLSGLEPWVENVLEAMPEIEVLTLFNESMTEYDPLIDKNNPHVWMNPLIAKEMVELIYEKLIELDETNAETYSTNKSDYDDELDALVSRINETRTEFEGKKVIVHHPAFKYLFDMLGIIRVASIEQSDGSEPSAADIVELLELIESEDVDLIVDQPQLKSDIVNQLARDAGLEIVELTPLLGVPDEHGYVLSKGALLETYIAMIDYDLEALRNPYPPSSQSLEWYWWVIIGLTGSVIVGLIVIVITKQIKK